MKSTVRRFLNFTLLAIVCLALLLGLTREWPDRTMEDYVYDSIVRNRRFDFVGWELTSLGKKGLYSLAPPHTAMEEGVQKELILEFFDQLREVQSLEREIATFYADPAVVDPDSATADLQGQLARSREELSQLGPLAEGIIEEQIAAVLADEGLTTVGRTFPPVKLHFTPLPSMLVVSPRDRIEAIRFVALEHGLETPDRVEMEAAVDERMNVSSLVSNIGGLAAYPAMMLESSAFNWVMEVGAHEWTHHYLTLHPLGVLYETDAELRTMNETAARIVGKEIGEEVVRRYYPELAPPPPPEPPAEPLPTPEPPSFDYGAEMHQTRVQVDVLLEQGLIEEAESYMEERRQFFWENGHALRKLNQAYFAFYGGYADEPGAQGEDPVGPAVVELRARSGSLREFIRAMAALTSFAELQELVQDQESGN